MNGRPGRPSKHLTNFPLDLPPPPKVPDTPAYTEADRQASSHAVQLVCDLSKDEPWTPSKKAKL